MSDETRVPAEDEKQPLEETNENETQTTQEDVQPAEEQSTKESDDSSERQEPIDRKVYTMPVAKAQEEKRKAVEKAKEEARAEAEAEMQRIRKEYELKLNPTQREEKAYDKSLSEVAEKHGLSVDAAQDLLDVFKSSIELPDLSKYDKLAEEREIEDAQRAVSKEFDESVVPIIKKEFPNATQEHIDSVKQQVQELAFTEGFNTYRLEHIYQIKRDEFKYSPGISAEGSAGHSSEIIDFDSLTDKEEHELAVNDPDTFRKYVEYKRGTGSRYND